MLHTFKKMYDAGILSPTGLYRLAGSLLRTGTNLATLLDFAAKRYPRKIAINYNGTTIAYDRLKQEVQSIAAHLANEYGLGSNRKTAIVCRNHANAVRALFATACTGADVYLLNIDMGPAQLQKVLTQHAFDVVIHDDEIVPTLMVATSRWLPATNIAVIADNAARGPIKKLPWRRGGKLVVLSGGTGGSYKTAARRPGTLGFIFPFAALLKKANLDMYRSVLIATPIYHGFGLAALMMSVVLGKEVFLMGRFNAGTATRLTTAHNIQVVTVVPVMLQRMLENDAAALANAQCIVTGGAPLSSALAEKAKQLAGNKLFNLYGTSEAGFCIMATPADTRYEAGTIGKPIPGVRCKVVNEHGQEVPTGTRGSLMVKTRWSALGMDRWVATGDIGYMNGRGYCFLCGRADEMIISGGENVYPSTLEHLLGLHKSVKEVAVTGVADADFGQRLKAWVVADETTENEELFAWIRAKGARYHVPVAIQRVTELPYTALGKPDKRRLAEL